MSRRVVERAVTPKYRGGASEGFGIDVKALLWTLGVGVGAASAVGAAYYYYQNYSSTSSTTSNQGKKPKELRKLTPDQQKLLDKAQKLKEKGNQLFKNSKYQEAIDAYTEALSTTDIDAHLLYGNRSAAFLALSKIDEAIGDAKKSIELNSSWSKGYFRLGKAYLARNDVVDAFITFRQGLNCDPKSDEIKKMIQQTSQRLAPFGKRAFRFTIQSKLVNNYLERMIHDATEQLGTSYEEIKQVIRSSMGKEDTVAELKNNHLIQRCLEKNPSLTNQVVALVLLLAFENAEQAVRFAKEGLKADPTNPKALIVNSIALIRFRRYVFKSWDEAVEILDCIREALLKEPKDLFITQNYLGFLVTLMQSIGTTECPISIPAILSELQLCLANDAVDKLQIAHTGVQLWFKQFEDPLIQARLMDEEREGERAGLPANEAYVQGLTSGAFKDLLLNPFFVQALSEVVLPFPQVERIVGPFRSSLITGNPSQNALDIASSFMHGVALQVFKTNYLWEVKPDEERRVNNLIAETNKMLEAPLDTLITDGGMERTLYHRLSMIAMFKPLSLIPRLEELVLKLDLTKLNPMFVTLLNKSILSPNEEDEIRESLVRLTPIPSNSDLLDYYESRITPTWDSLPVAVISKVSFKQELEWRYPYFKPPASFDEPIQVLIAACGSGKEVCQTLITYRDVEVTGVDFSAKNVAYAVRQTHELGFAAKFYVADVLKLTPSHFGASNNTGPFDFINANDFLHYVSEPVAHLKALAGLLKPGGVMTVTLHNKRLASTLKYVRTLLAPRIIPPIFDTNDIPRLTRIPSDEELQIARKKLLDVIEGKNPAVEVAEIISTTAFYSLNEFRDLVFHPQLHGFTFANVGEMLQQAGLNLVGFDFPELLNEKELAYQADYPDDPHMKNYQHLDEFDAKEPAAFSGLFLSFTCQKPM